MSITRPSIKNSRKYLRTEGVPGSSGVPKLTINTPTIGKI